MTILVNIIGAGKLGKTIAALLYRNQLVRIGAVCNTSEKTTLDAINFIGDGNYCAAINALPSADITFITTADDAISTISEELCTNPQLKSGSIIVHCSGVLSSDALMTVKEKNCYIASIHPMRSFAQPESSIVDYPGTYCAMEGDSDALAIISPLFTAIGSICYPIEKNKKSLYHAAGVFASNYIVTLAHQALSCLKEAGVDNDLAMKSITNLMYGTVANLEKNLSPERSLTGPMKRGDVSTLQMHMKALATIGKQGVYASLAKATLPLTTLDEDTNEQMLQALGYIVQHDI